VTIWEFFNYKIRSIPQFWLFTLLTTIALLKLYLLFFSEIGNNRLLLDEYTNLDYANSIKNNFSYSAPAGVAYRPPMYSIFLAAIKLLIGNKIVYYKLANILLSLGTVLFVASCFTDYRRLYSAFFIACYPPFFILYELVLAENLAIFLVAAFVKFYFIYQRKKNWPSIVAIGAIAGCIALTRPESIIFLIFALLILLRRDRRMWVALAVLFIFIQIWMLRNYTVLNRYPLISTNSANTFYLATFPESTGTSIYVDDDSTPYPTFRADLYKMKDMNEVQKYDYFIKMGWQYLREYPSVFFSLLPVRVLTLLAPESTIGQKLIRTNRFQGTESFYSLFVAAAWLWYIVLWLALALALYKHKTDFFYLAFLIGIICSVLFVIAEARYKIQIMPALVVGVFHAFDNKK